MEPRKKLLKEIGFHCQNSGRDLPLKINLLRLFLASVFLVKASWNNCLEKRNKFGPVFNKRWTLFTQSSPILSFSSLTSSTFSWNLLTTRMKELKWELKYKNWSNTTQREISLRNMTTKNTLMLLMKSWKKSKNSTPNSLLVSFLQDLKLGQMKRMKRCLPKSVSWNGNILWDSTLSKNKPFTAPWLNTME